MEVGEIDTNPLPSRNDPYYWDNLRKYLNKNSKDLENLTDDQVIEQYEMQRNQNKRKWEAKEELLSKAKGDVLSKHIQSLDTSERIKFTSDYLNSKLSKEVESRPEDFRSLPQR
jgi:hypothetical protein